MLAGEILVYAEGTEHRVGPGGVAVVPRGARQAFLVTSEMAQILALQTLGSGEAFYRDASQPSTDETDAERPADFDRLRTAAERHPSCIEILGPPLFEAAKEFAARAKPRARCGLTTYQAGCEDFTPKPGGTLWRDRNSSMTSCGNW
jgi:hypothetical protein